MNKYKKLKETAISTRYTEKRIQTVQKIMKVSELFTGLSWLQLQGIQKNEKEMNKGILGCY